MDKNLYNLSSIESFFDGLFANKLSENTFFGDLPRAISDNWETIVVVDVSYVSTRDAYAFANVAVELYAKPFSDGSKNVGLLDKMERELIKIVEESNDEHYRIRNGGSYVTYDSKRNLHLNTRIIELVIV